VWVWKPVIVFGFPACPTTSTAWKEKMSTTLALLLSFHLMQQTKVKQNVNIINMAYNENFNIMRKKDIDTISMLMWHKWKNLMKQGEFSIMLIITDRSLRGSGEGPLWAWLQMFW
jgi:hypothetical protein